MYFKVAPNGWSDSALFLNLPFMDQMFYTSLLSIAIILIVSRIEGQGQEDEKAIPLSKKLFETPPAFNISAFAIMILLVFLYAFFW